MDGIKTTSRRKKENLDKGELVMTELQATITKEHLQEICRLLYPDLPKDTSLNHLTWNYSYSWVTVNCKVKGYGTLSFGINNHHSGAKLLGKISKEKIKESLENGVINFKVWKFVDDIYYHKNGQFAPFPKIPEEVYEFLNKHYRKPTVEEFYREYYND